MRLSLHDLFWRKRLICELRDLSKAEIIALVAWCFDRNMKVSTVAINLWQRELREQVQV